MCEVTTSDETRQAAIDRLRLEYEAWIDQSRHRGELDGKQFALSTDYQTLRMLIDLGDTVDSADFAERLWQILGDSGHVTERALDEGEYVRGFSDGVMAQWLEIRSQVEPDVYFGILGQCLTCSVWIPISEPEQLPLSNGDGLRLLLCESCEELVRTIKTRDGGACDLVALKMGLLHGTADDLVERYDIALQERQERTARCARTLRIVDSE